MKTVWKWVIGIVVVLVVVAVLVGGAFLLRYHLMNVVGVARLTRPGTQVPGDRYHAFWQQWKWTAWHNQALPWHDAFW